MSQERFINIRKLAAFDLYFRRSTVILVEFGFAVFGLGTLGSLAVLLGLTRSSLATAIGIYLLFLGIDYAPLLVYAIEIVRKSSARQELQNELADLGHSRTKYGIQQTLIMVPLFIPLLAISQELNRRKR